MWSHNSFEHFKWIQNTEHTCTMNGVQNAKCAENGKMKFTKINPVMSWI